MTHFFCDIKILCVQNNKAHFLFNIKLNGHLTYIIVDEKQKETRSQTMQLLISWFHTIHLWLQGSSSWDGWESCNDLVEYCWAGRAIATEIVDRWLHKVQISLNCCSRQERSLSASFPRMDNLEDRHKLWVGRLLTEPLGRWLWRVKHASENK